MDLNMVFIPADEGGFTAYVEEIPAAITQGETMDEARDNLRDALRMVLEANRELARESEPVGSVRESLTFDAL
jgi:predicted RNase H-like HicB family nuclease